MKSVVQLDIDYQSAGDRQPCWLSDGDKGR
jgi:hypothetical protein